MRPHTTAHTTQRNKGSNSPVALPGDSEWTALEPGVGLEERLKERVHVLRDTRLVAVVASRIRIGEACTARLVDPDHVGV